jgi:hypothetical protein
LSKVGVPLNLYRLKNAKTPMMIGPFSLSKKWLVATFLSFFGFRLSHSLPGGKTRKVRKPIGFHPF